MRTRLLSILIVVLLVCACEPDLNYKIKGYTQKIIVEGSIATNEYPKVYLSLNNPAWQQVDSLTILKNVIRVAKVTVSDGTKTEILTSSWEKDHFPPYVYKGTDIRGEEGKTYSLKVEYSGYTVESKTTIPIGTPIDKFETTPVTGNDTMKSLSMTFSINPANKTAFRVFTKKMKDKQFTNTNIVFNSELTLSGQHNYAITREDSNDTNFVIGDSVLVRFCAIDSISASFFNDMSIFSSGSGLGANIFIGEKKSLNSNISSPGFGIWWGAAVRNYSVIIK